jgi:hypothetical protein
MAQCPTGVPAREQAPHDGRSDDAHTEQGKFGYSAASLTALAVVELTCALLYLVPQTSVLGAILVTGYLGGAVATHVRVGEAFVMPLLLGVIAWVGLFLRDERLRVLLPVRRPAVS